MGPLPPILVRRVTISIFMLRPPEADEIFSENACSVGSLEYSVAERRSETACRIVSTKPSNPATTGGNWTRLTALKSARHESHDCPAPGGTTLFAFIRRAVR